MWTTHSSCIKAKREVTARGESSVQEGLLTYKVRENLSVCIGYREEASR